MSACCKPAKDSLLPANKMKDRVRIELISPAQDPALGTAPDVWLPLATVWAWVQDVLPSKTAESVVGNLRMEYRPARIRIHYRTDVTSSMRLVLLNRSNRVMKIVAGPAEFGNRKGLELTAEEYSAMGVAS